MKLRLNFSIRKGLVDTKFDSYEIDSDHFLELMSLKEFETFNRDGYLTVSCDVIDEDTVCKNCGGDGCEYCDATKLSANHNQSAS